MIYLIPMYIHCCYEGQDSNTITGQRLWNGWRPQITESANGSRWRLRRCVAQLYGSFPDPTKPPNIRGWLGSGSRLALISLCGFIVHPSCVASLGVLVPALSLPLVS